MCNLIDSHTTFSMCEGDTQQDSMKMVMYLLHEYKNELVTMIGSSMNKYLDQQCVLTHNLNYVSYFYYLHPLHINSFKELFTYIPFHLTVLSCYIRYCLSHFDCCIISFISYLQCYKCSCRILNCYIRYIIYNFECIKFVIRSILCIKCDLTNLKKLNYNIKLLKFHINSIRTHINNILKVVKCISCIDTCLESSTRFFIGIISNKMEKIECYIFDLEYCIESVVKEFLKCSNTSTSCILYRMITNITNNIVILPDSTTRTSLITQSISLLRKSLLQYLWVILSHATMTESKLLVSKLYDCRVKIDHILNSIYWVDYCHCVTQVDYKFNGVIYNAKRDYLSILYLTNLNDYNYSKFYKNQIINNEGNHLCLCLVINCSLYFSLIKCICLLRDNELEKLGGITRKFHNFTELNSFKLGISSLVFFIEILYKIVNWIKNRYKFESVEFPHYYFCINTKDSYYIYFISIILYVCTLVQDLLSLDNVTISKSLQSLSSIMSEFYAMDCDVNKTTTTGGSEGETQEKNSQRVRVEIDKSNVGSNYFSYIISPYSELRRRLFKFMISSPIPLDRDRFYFKYYASSEIIYNSKSNATWFDICLSINYDQKIFPKFYIRFVFSIPDINKVCSENCVKSKIILLYSSKLYNIIKLVSYQISNSSIVLYTMGYILHKNKLKEVIQNTTNNNTNYNKRLITITKNNRMSDYTHQLGYYNNNNDSQNNLNLNPKYYTYDNIYRHVGEFIMVDSKYQHLIYIKSK